MNLALDAHERGMRDGTHGPAVRLAMRILTRMAPLYGASSLLPVTRAHIDALFSQAPLDLSLLSGSRISAARSPCQRPSTSCRPTGNAGAI